MPNLISALKDNHTNYAPKNKKKLLSEEPYIFDFTQNNSSLGNINITDIQKFSAYVNSVLKKAGKKIGAGGYGENRILYFSSLFKETEESRSVHLGMDLWMPAGTEIFLPLEGRIHSFKDNNRLLDYGPAIIVEHSLDGVVFYSLYGHLSRSSLWDLKVGQKIAKGQKFASLGESSENGQWPPHLHFQIISDMLGMQGDFPGVCKPSEQAYYLNLCPNPNLILQIPNLP